MTAADPQHEITAPPEQQSSAASWRYLLLLFSLTSAIMLSIFFYIDQLDLYGQRQTPGTSTTVYRPDMITREQFRIKPYSVLAAQPDALILGGSIATRVPTAHPFWNGERTYNASWLMMGPYESYRMLQSANSKHPITHVLLVTDELLFNSNIDAGFREDRFLVDLQGNRNHWLWLQQFADRWNIAFASSTRQWLLNRSLLPDNLLLTSEGEWDALPQFFDIKSTTWLRLQNIVRNPVYVTPVYDSYRLFIDYCYAHHIKLDIIIPPKHSAVLSATEMQGVLVQPTLDDWKRQITIINTDAAAQSGSTPYTIWDFENYGAPYWHEIDNHVMQQQDIWFWDGMHANQGMFVCMLDFLLAEKSVVPTTRSECRAMATAITPQNIDGHLAELTARRAEFRLQHPALHAALLAAKGSGE